MPAPDATSAPRPPDPLVPWGAAEWLALGDYWMAVSSDGGPSYGSAMDSYVRAVRHAGDDVALRATTEDGYNRAMAGAQAAH